MRSAEFVARQQGAVERGAGLGEVVEGDVEEAGALVNDPLQRRASGPALGLGAGGEGGVQQG